MAKATYACVECGYRTPKPLGRCPSCGSWESFQEVAPAPASRRAKPSPLPLLALLCILKGNLPLQQGGKQGLAAVGCNKVHVRAIEGVCVNKHAPTVAEGTTAHLYGAAQEGGSQGSRGSRGATGSSRRSVSGA